MSNVSFAVNGGCANTAAGSITQLVAIGAMDAYLSKNAKFTWWKMRYVRYTNFAMEAVIQPFNSPVAFGQTAQITLNRTGDLVHFMYVLIEIPGISAEAGGNDSSGFPTVDECTRNNDWAAYCQYLDPSELESCAASPDSDDKMKQALAKGKQMWLREKYGCCTNSSDFICSPDQIPADSDKPAWACWTNAIGQLLIRCASIIIGGSTIDSIYNDFLYMWEELTGKPGKKLQEMIGKRYTRDQLIADSQCARILYVPLPFWFTQHSGQSLSLASLQFHGVQIQVEFERLQNCIIVSEKDVTVKNCASACCLGNSDLAAALETTYVYLDTVERQKFATTAYEQLIVQLQHYNITSTQSQIRMQLNFNHPVIELIFAVRRQCNEKCNNWFDWSGIDNRDPVIKACLFLNNQARFQNKPGGWLRMVQPYQFHTNIPDCFIYNYSFALHPEEPSPSGSCNMSRIDHVDLVLDLQEALANETVKIIVYARNWNLLRIQEGLGGLAFSS